MGTVPFGAKRSDCLWLDPNDIVIATDKDSPFWDPRAELPVNENMAQNMLYELQGVLEPILVAKDGSKPTVIDGRQRVKALRRANEILAKQGCEPLKCPCLLKRGNGNLLFTMSLSTNEQRVNDTPLEKSRKLVRLLNQGVSYNEAAKIFGVTLATIQRWEELSELDDNVAEAVESGEISATKAAKLSKQPRHEQTAAESQPRKPRKRGPRTIAEIKAMFGLVDPRTESVLRWVLRENDALGDALEIDRDGCE